MIHNTFGQIFSKTVKKLLNLTPLKKYEGITNFFGSLVNVIIDIFTRRLRNLEETQEELNLTIEQYAEINRYRGIKVLQEGYYTRKVDRDKLFKILYVAEVAKAENISFYDWPEKYNKKCREHSFWKGYEKYAIVITEITNTELREVFPNPCLKKIYTLDDNINVEEKCLELLKISKDSFDQQKRKCYYYPKNVINNDDENIQKIETSSKFIKKSILQKPKPIICFITKINIHQFKHNFLQINSLDSKEENIIKANILDFSIEQNKLNSYDTNNNKIIRYISNEKNYQ